MFEKVKINKFGFYELRDKPAKHELEEYYSKKYFQDSRGTYKKEYSKNELKYISNKINRKYSIVSKYLQNNNNLKFLDVGCGEGWALKYFHTNNWQVKGLDYSIYGCNFFNPDMKKFLIDGDIFKNLNSLIARKEKFDLILLDNVLEHVLEPDKLIKNIKEIITENGILIIEVPNDFSILQKYLFDNNKINNPFWVAAPDHISYFNKNGLENLCLNFGWDLIELNTDYPIDLNLLNPDTNYVTDKSKGKNVHLSRIEIENLFDEISTKKSIDLFSIYAQMGLGRNIIAYFKPKQ